MPTPAELGVEPPASALPTPPAPAPTRTPAPVDPNAKTGDIPPVATPPGTGTDPKTPPAPNPDPPAPVDPKDERINNLMSKWQKEEHQRTVTQTELERYKAQFGELPANGNPPAPRPAAPAVRTPQGADDLPTPLKPGWAPQTMEEFQQGLSEIAQYGAKMAHQSLQEQSDARAQATQVVDDFVAEIRSADPEFNDKLFFGYADKYKFPVSNIDDLRRVYVAFTDNNRAIREAEARGAKNRDGRTDPIGKPGAGAGGGNGAMPFSKISQAHSAADLIHDVLRNQ